MNALSPDGLDQETGKFSPLESQGFVVGAEHIVAATASTTYRRVSPRAKDGKEKLMTDVDIRITADQLKRRVSAGEEFTVVDARNPQAWAGARDKAAGAIRVDLHSNEPLPRLPQDKPIVVYCT